jgi:hypothetical protein
MSAATTPTTANFTATDALLYHEGQRKWYRFVPYEQDYIALFQGEGGQDAQSWAYIVTINKVYARSVWDAAVNKGYIKME